MALAVSIGLFAGSWSDAELPQAASMRVADPAIADREVKLYIDVYSEMQRDHDLRIEDMVAARGLSLAEFRDIERRIQTQAAVIKRVREALVEQAKSHAASLAFPAPVQESAR